MLLTNLIIPLSIINAAILITLVIFLVKTATQSVDILRDLSPILYVLTKHADRKFRVPRQVEDVATKNFIITVAYLSLLILIIHSIINMITVKSKCVSWKLALLRIICEHATSLIRVFFCLVGCLIFTAIAAVDLTVCMPTPIFPLMTKQTIFSKAQSVYSHSIDHYIPGTFLPNTDSMKIEKRSVRKEMYEELNEGDINYTICDYCDNTPDKLPNICKVYNQQKTSIRIDVFNILSYKTNKSKNMHEIVGVTFDNRLILSCDSGRTYVSLGVLTPLRDYANLNKEIKRVIRDTDDDEKSEEQTDEDDPPYDNILMDTTVTHQESCKRSQELLPEGLLLTAFVLTCMTVILLLSRYERNPCKCGYQEKKCVCEAKVCGCRARGAGSTSPSEMSDSDTSISTFTSTAFESYTDQDTNQDTNQDTKTCTITTK